MCKHILHILNNLKGSNEIFIYTFKTKFIHSSRTTILTASNQN